MVAWLIPSVLIGLMTAGLCAVRNPLRLVLQRLLRRITGISQQTRNLQRTSELNSELQLARFEISWLHAAAERRHRFQQLHAILQQASGPGKPLQAWFLQKCQVVNLSAAAPGSLPQLSDPLWSLLAGRPVLRVMQQPHTGQLIPAQDPPDRENSMTVFRCGPPEAECCLIVNRLPRLHQSEELTEALLERLCLSLPLTHPHQKTALSAEAPLEFSLVREMLELRTLTDGDFSTPEQLLEEFLSRLAELTGYERAGFYRVESTDSLQLLAGGGMPLPRDLYKHWCEREIKLAQQSRTGILAIPIPHAPPLGTDTLPRIQSALACRVNHEDQQAVVVLTSRNPIREDHSDCELLEWATQYLMHALDRVWERCRIEKQARCDALTGTANRRVFEEEFSELLSGRAAVPCSLLILDIDHFKSINDHYGHLAGDRALVQVAQRILDSVRRSRSGNQPLVARYGGEEFVVLLPDVPLSGARIIADRILENLRSRPIEAGEHSLHVTASIGIAAHPLHGGTAEDLIVAADQALYDAKHDGRDQVVIAASPTATSV